MHIDPIFEPFLASGRTLVLDGGLATELERRGLDLNDPLWSAKILMESPEIIGQVHRDYLEAGADCIITSTYQATFQGLAARGLSHREASALLLTSVQLALQARDQFGTAGNRAARPLVAGGIGPYGAYLADGSEYRGDYDLSRAELVDFHRERWHLLAQSGVDFLACETIPSIEEAAAFVALADESPGTKFVLSFSCSDELTISDGTRVAEIGAEIFGHQNLIAVGVNCTSPRYVESLIEQFRAGTELPILVYPNSGEQWDAEAHRWVGTAHPEEFGAAAQRWRAAGAAIIGGCCRTGPNHIANIGA